MAIQRSSTSTGGALPRDVWLLGISGALIASGFLGMTQLLKTLYVLRLGLGAGYIGILFAVGAGSYALASVPAGVMGARWGARPVMLAGCLINLAAMCLLPLTESMPGPLRPLWPLLFQSIAPFGWAMFIVNQVPAIMSLTAAENRKAAYAAREAMYGVGMFLGALIGGALPDLFARIIGTTTASPTPYSYALWVAVAVVGAALAPLAMSKPAQVAARPILARGKRPPLSTLTIVALSGFLVNSVMVCCRAFIPAYLDRIFGLSTSLIGLTTAIGLFVAVFAALSSSRLARGGNSAFGMVAASLAMAGFMLLVALAPVWAAVGLGLIGSLAVMSVWMPSAQIVQMESVPPEWRSLAAGMVAMASSLGFAAMSLAGGFIVENLGYPPLILLGALLGLLSAVFSLPLLRTRVAVDTTIVERV